MFQIIPLNVTLQCPTKKKQVTLSTFLVMLTIHISKRKKETKNKHTQKIKKNVTNLIEFIAHYACKKRSIFFSYLKRRNVKSSLSLTYKMSQSKPNLNEKKNTQFSIFQQLILTMQSLFLRFSYRKPYFPFHFPMLLDLHNRKKNGFDSMPNGWQNSRKHFVKSKFESNIN